MSTWTPQMTAEFTAGFCAELRRLLRVKAKPPTTAEMLESLRQRQRRRQAESKRFKE